MDDPSAGAAHRVVRADCFKVPSPFACYAVRSDEERHAFDARTPYGRMHLLRADFLDPAALGRLAAQGRQRMRLDAFPDIDYAPVTRRELADAAPGVDDPVARIAAALRLTGVLGPDVEAYREAVAARIDYLGAHGAGFHNDVGGHWPSCLFWNLALAAHDIEFVMPHAGVRLRLMPGDLMVFDQTMAHGLCRPADGGQAVAASFESHGEGSDDCRQVFLAGELPLTDEQWAALGSPWRPIEWHHAAGALDLMAAEFDERSGAIKSLRALAGRMLRTADETRA